MASSESRSKARSDLLPKASRPFAPGYGMPAASKGLLPWKWAETRLVNSHNYWLMTVKPEGFPHAMPIWGIWVDRRFYFSTGKQSRKAKNLGKNKHCIVATEKAHEAVIVEGSAKSVRAKQLLKKLAPHYFRKYKPWRLDPSMGPIFEVRPLVVFGMYEKKFEETATKWEF